MISFFTYQNYLGPKVRGEEIAQYMKAIFNSKKSTEKVRGDVNIHVKPKNFSEVMDGDWVDITDGEWVPALLKERPKVNAIAGSLYTYEIFKEKLPNKMVWISQQHLNWDREKRERLPFYLIAGYIGGPSQYTKDLYKEVGERLKEIGINFVTCFDFKDRRDAIKFYKLIDVLIVADPKDDHIYKTPTKLINAASFGVPSIAIPLKGYREWDGNYIKLNNLNELYKATEEVKKDYDFWSDKVIKASEYFHISNVSKRYEELSDIH
jgi:hypothetical protein